MGPRAAARLKHEGGLDNVFHYPGGRKEWSAYGLPLGGADAAIVRAGALADRDFPRCDPGDSATQVLSCIGDHTACAVTNEDGVFLGRLYRHQAEQHPGSRAWHLMSPRASTFRPDVPATEMADWFRKRPRLDHFFVTTPDGRVFGILYRAAVEHVLRSAGADVSRP